VGIEERANECEVLAPLVTSSGCRVTNVALETEVGRQLQGTLLEAALVLPGGGQPCIVIRCPSELNGGASCEEVLPIARLLLSLNICVFALDISSSHMYCDASDVACAVRRLRDRGFRAERGWPVPTAESTDGDQLPSIALWGRSAGANAALSYAAADPMTTALISDGAYSDLPSLLGLPSWMASPFAGLKRIAEDMADAGSCAREPHPTAQTSTPAPPMHAPPWEVVSKLWMPAFYVHGELGRKVPPSCARALRDSHAGESQPQVDPVIKYRALKSEPDVYFVCEVMTVLLVTLGFSLSSLVI